MLPDTPAGRRLAGLLSAWGDQPAPAQAIGWAPVAGPTVVESVREWSPTRVAALVRDGVGERSWVFVEVGLASPHDTVCGIRLPAARDGTATALSAAVARAVHLRDRPPHVFVDDIAERLLPSASVPTAPRAGPQNLTVVVRSRCAEDAMEAAYATGCRQYVVLGAGLDTFAWRRGDLPFVRVFEVDRPAVQRWKRERLAAAGLGVPDSLSFVGVDFERDSVGEALVAAGLRFNQPAVFSWLGVTGYLGREAIEDTLRMVASGTASTEVVFDYTDAAAATPSSRALRDVLELVGEPLLSTFTPGEVAALVVSCGLELVEDMSPADAGRRYLAGHPDGLEPTGDVRIARARVPARQPGRRRSEAGQ